ncbi:MAG: nucleoside monophosphate kinase [Chloroherpetonaceae bacterium]|nr:nucleoside monophosphate kinase [Chthonomonadaceae bacterium]MDW8208035.1 nucleoside monophosphate kinase [Chloroherpetonaceae bacterium]
MTVAPDRIAWLQGSAFRCDPEPEAPERVYRLALLGPPGVGKGTQAELLCQHLGTCHLSTGDVFRAAFTGACTLSPALAAAQDTMRRGELVPDDVVILLVRERSRCLRCRGGFLLDGFPRTVVQARALDAILAEQGIALDGVISYHLPLDAIVARLGGRRICPQCKAVYHVTSHPPRQEGICDHCGTALVRREDDCPEAIRVRMQAYEADTCPLIDYYQAAGKLISIPASGTPEEILLRTLAALGVPEVQRSGTGRA